jgi:glycosyltransferase involved in cell wall biosynthesis
MAPRAATARAASTSSGLEPTEAMRAVWHARPDLQTAFDLSSPGGTRGYLEWYADNVAAARSLDPGPAGLSTRISHRLRAWHRLLPPPAQRVTRTAHRLLTAWRARLGVLAGRLRGRTSLTSAGWDHALQTSVAPGDPSAPTAPGIRIIGNVCGESGMGHSLRSFAAACDTQQVPHALVESRARNPSRRIAVSPAGSAADATTLRANVLYMPLDQVGHAIVALGEHALRDRYTILMPFWELSTCPAEWKHAASSVDELWAPTRFVQDALATLSPLPSQVLHMPPCVPAPQPRIFTRAEVGLKTETFLFFFSFDFFSYPERKNPLAVVAAFREAFPMRTEAVSLLISAMNADERSPYWQRLRAAVDSDPRITLRSKRMPHDEVLGLCRLSDCYVSLHRSEGFGYAPAEAMLLGKPVILTNYSGPCDYARPDNTCLVNFNLVNVGPRDYVHHEGRMWADPDVSHAAWHMRQLVASPSMAAEIGRRGRLFLESHYAPAVVGLRYRQRLQDLGILNR